MSWPKAEQLKAERAWFKRTTGQIGAECGGSLISGRRTRARQAQLRAQGLNPHPKSLHLDDLAEDWEFDTAHGYGRAWELGRKAGLHGYKKPKSLGVHWQARPAVRQLRIT
jgi:hypothetical protein